LLLLSITEGVCVSALLYAMAQGASVPARQIEQTGGNGLPRRPRKRMATRRLRQHRASARSIAPRCLKSCQNGQLFRPFPPRTPPRKPKAGANCGAGAAIGKQYQTASFGIRPTHHVRSWTRQASYTCRYRLADIVPSRLPFGPNLVAATTAAACRRAGRNPCRSVVAVAPFVLSVHLNFPG
jgi:hypothetical protein